MRENNQLKLFRNPKFPTTRYQGSKVKLIDWIWDKIKGFEFDTVLDAFGGTGSVGYKLKQEGKEVAYNDYLKFNWYIGLALIENDNVLLEKDDINSILYEDINENNLSFIYDTFNDIYFTDEENKWLDNVISNIKHIDNIFKQAIAYASLFQACLVKRPFNLFHRKNLYLRFNDVERSFGNKVTWDTPFEEHYRKYISEINNAIFSNNRKNKAINYDVFQINQHFDLIYIDTPYISSKGVGVDYLGFYHFLEGIVNYSNWGNLLNLKSKHKRMVNHNNSAWAKPKEIYESFEKLIKKYQDSILVISYRSDGIPSIIELKSLLKKYKSNVIEERKSNYKYVLSKTKTEEVLLIGI
ncbi:DNA adenine methylase [candidate division KSB1 bacterium]|nr:DNA adenine methylase [candidate division KSB1 bacterium]MBL7094919.1 DNA adenine methylase [candidate division KSB1 bacterium]